MWNNLVDNLTDASSLLYFLFAILAIGGGVVMINSTKVVHMVVALAASFLSLAGLYVMLNAEFVAFVQVLIYAGAVSILMIFGIMMTKHRAEESEDSRPAHSVLLAVGTLALFGILFYAIQRATFPEAAAQPVENNPLEIGKLLFNVHVIPFEIMSVLLTVAFIGAIIVAKREED